MLGDQNEAIGRRPCGHFLEVRPLTGGGFRRSVLAAWALSVDG